MVKTKRASSSSKGSLTRRDLLKIGGIALPAAMVLPPWLSANAQAAAAPFDFYISPTGADSNPGTVASPWAITSLRTSSANWSKLPGKRIGLLPGTYNVGSIMTNDPVSGALQVPGGTSGSWTYLGSSDANGNYSARTATITAYYNGLYGGHNATGPGNWDGPILSHTGQWPTAYPVGYLTIDGIVFSGFSYKGVRIGGNSSGDGPVITAPVTIQNCEFTGGGYNSGDYGDNMVALWIDPFQPASGQGCLVTNNWFHDTVGQGGSSSMDHLNGIIVLGFSTQTWGIEVSYNTCVNAGNIYGKEGGVNGCNVHHNYVDVSMYTVGSTGLEDFMSGGGSFSGLTHPSTFNNNIVLLRGGTVGGNGGIGFPTLSQTNYGSAYGWQTPVSIYNNTIVCVSGSAGALAIMADAALNGSGIGRVKVYNNIYVNNGISGSWNGYGNFLTTPKSPAVWDYNLYPVLGAQWAIVPDANNLSLCASHTIYSTAASFAAAVASGGGISGVDAHSVIGVVPTFANTGSYAELYKLASGSAGIGKGSSDGTPSGTPCDMGAWGNGATWIGCNFGYDGPEPPVLSVS